MKAADSLVTEVPPDVARYLKGAPPQARQFDFLLGDWDVAAIRYKEDGSVLVQYKAIWSARSLNDGRMVMDDFRAQAPTGQDVSSYVTLRTWSESTGRWEMTGLAAFQPSVPMQWHGYARDGEMQLDASATDPQGAVIRTRIRFFDIEKDGFSWDSRTSMDDGKRWVRTASLTASRAR